MRNMTKALAGAAAATLLLTSCSGASGAGGKEKVSLMMDVGLLPKHALFYAAKEHGFYEAAGFDVNILPGTGSKDTALAVSAGRVDFGFADFAMTAVARAEGADVKQIGLVQAETAYATVTTEGRGIEGWDDLKGKTVATEAGGAMTAMWPLALEKAGLAPGDVEVVAATGQAKIPGLLSKQWDATLAFFISDEPVLKAQGESPVVLKWSDIGISMYGNGIVASSKTLGDGDKASRFMDATLRGAAWACQNQEQAAQALMKSVTEMGPEAAQAGVEAACSILASDEMADLGLGAMSDKGAERVVDLAGNYLGLDAGKVTPSDLYTNDYLPEVRVDEKMAAPAANEG
ncbi:ABC transporter substrate-binding protein [Arthrobacter ginkgonis]|uniref:ABC transporter substrate-binding protein n=1 Tax=Arthrobacter ginkgonis TaxID=1630594 RepID=A0ABP7DFC2_9MICC